MPELTASGQDGQRSGHTYVPVLTASRQDGQCSGITMEPMSDAWRADPSVPSSRVRLRWLRNHVKFQAASSAPPAHGPTAPVCLHKRACAKGVGGKLETHLGHLHLQSPSLLSELHPSGCTTVPEAWRTAHAGCRVSRPSLSPPGGQPRSEDRHSVKTGPRRTGVAVSKEKQKNAGSLAEPCLQRDRVWVTAEEGSAITAGFGEGQPPPS